MEHSAPARPLPALNDDNRAFWTGGGTGKLMIDRCGDCRTYIHPPVPFCPACESRNVTAEPVSGRGKITTFTINHKQWVPDLAVPYVLALVEIDEDPTVRIPTNIICIDPEKIAIDMPVEVVFEQVEEVFVPLFRPIEG